MIETSGGGLNPLEPAAADRFFPGDRNFGMPAKNVGRWEFERNIILARVNNLSLRPRRLDAGDVFWLNWVTENDSHAY